MPDRKKALIAGATGVVGRNLLRHLLTLRHASLQTKPTITPEPVGGVGEPRSKAISRTGSLGLDENFSKLRLVFN